MLGRLFLFASILLLCVSALCGCGGGGGTSPLVPTQTSGLPSVAVDWPLRTRNLLGPSSAASVRVVLTNTAPGQPPIEIDGNRSSNLAAHTESYAATANGFVGNYSLVATFYSGPSLQGIVVATASANVAVSNGGVVTNSNGVPLSPISFSGVVAFVTITAGQVLPIGTPTQLVASAADVHHSLLALSPGSFNFSVVSGGGSLSVTPDGIATGIASGQAMVTATVDGVTSPQIAISVSPQTPSISVDWPLRTRNPLGPSSALSVGIVLTSTQSSAENVTINANRSPALAAHTETYLATSTVYSGPYTMTATFYSQANQQGIAVGTASASVAVSSTGIVTNTDGSPLSPIAFTGAVTSVVISPGQTALIGIASQLVVTAKNTQGNTLALTPGSFVFAVTSGGSFVTVTPDGLATGVSAGPATVTATVDGVTSPAATVTAAQSVDFANPGFESPQITANTWIADNDTPPFVPWTGHHQQGVNTWGVENGASTWGQSAHSGTQFAFIQCGASIQQTVTGLVAGQQYQVQLWMCSRDGDVGGNTPCPITISENGNVILPTTTPPGPGLWTEYTTNTFTSDGSPCLFLFQGINPGYDASDLLDDVHLIPVSAAHKRKG